MVFPFSFCCRRRHDSWGSFVLHHFARDHRVLLHPFARDHRVLLLANTRVEDCHSGWFLFARGLITHTPSEMFSRIHLLRASIEAVYLYLALDQPGTSLCFIILLGIIEFCFILLLGIIIIIMKLVCFHHEPSL